MNTRINKCWKAPDLVATPVKEDYELITKIEPISFNEDKTIKEYVEKSEYVLKKSLWKDFIKSFDLGSISEQVMNHITKGTPLITAHTLPDGDYTPDSLLKGAEIKRQMAEKGITLDMLVEAFKKANESSVKTESEVASNG